MIHAITESEPVEPLEAHPELPAPPPPTVTAKTAVGTETQVSIL
jgi:hypothetical protein